jgi:DNA-binding transcriptional ArsR family regulator
MPRPHPHQHQPVGLEGAREALLVQAGALFKTLGDPSRLRLLQVLQQAAVPIAQGELARSAELTVPNASKHLALLAREGLVRRTASGVQVFFEPVEPLVSQVCGYACAFIRARGEASLRALN